MEWLATLGRTLGFSLAAGVNLYATVAILGLASRYQWVAASRSIQGLRQPVDHRRGRRAVCDRVCRRQGAVGRFDLGLGAHADSSRSAARLIAVASLGDASPAMTALIALLGGTVAAEQSRHQGRHARRREHQPRTVQQLVPEPRRRRVRDRLELHHAEVSAGRARRQRRDPDPDRDDRAIDLEVAQEADPAEPLAIVK